MAKVHTDRGAANHPSNGGATGGSRKESDAATEDLSNWEYGIIGLEEESADFLSYLDAPTEVDFGFPSSHVIRPDKRQSTSGSDSLSTSQTVTSSTCTTLSPLRPYRPPYSLSSDYSSWRDERGNSNSLLILPEEIDDDDEDGSLSSVGSLEKSTELTASIEIRTGEAFQNSQALHSAVKRRNSFSSGSSASSFGSDDDDFDPETAQSQREETESQPCSQGGGKGVMKREFAELSAMILDSSCRSRESSMSPLTKVEKTVDVALKEETIVDVEEEGQSEPEKSLKEIAAEISRKQKKRKLGDVGKKEPGRSANGESIAFADYFMRKRSTSVGTPGKSPSGKGGKGLAASESSVKREKATTPKHQGIKDTKEKATMKTKPKSTKGTKAKKETLTKKKKTSNGAKNSPFIDETNEIYLSRIEIKGREICSKAKAGEIIVIEPAPGADDDGFNFWLAIVLHPLAVISSRRAGVYDGIDFPVGCEAVYIRYLNRTPKESKTKFFYDPKEAPRLISPGTVRGVIPNKAMVRARVITRVPHSSRWFVLRDETPASVQRMISRFKRLCAAPSSPVSPPPRPSKSPAVAAPAPAPSSSSPASPTSSPLPPSSPPPPLPEWPAPSNSDSSSSSSPYSSSSSSSPNSDTPLSMLAPLAYPF